MFSPITQRSWKVRLVFLVFYAVLFLGAISMVVPFLIMISGSVEPSARMPASLFPAMLVSEDALWNRYLEAKYQGTPDLLRMAWDDQRANFRDQRLGAPDKDTALWQAFVRENGIDARFWMLGFLRPNPRMPSYSARQFRLDLLRQEGSLEGVNRQLGTRFSRVTAIQPPAFSLIGPARPDSELVRRFEEFCARQPSELLVPWNAGGYFRSVFLPNLHGDVAAYNARHGTSYSSFREIPFEALSPKMGESDWFFFVSKILCTDFVELTEPGEARRAAEQIGKDEFIRTKAKPEDLRVSSIDVRYTEWASTRGVSGARIPQQTLDQEAFLRSKAFWRGQFVILNYQYVLDEILLHGRAILNTLILVILTIGGALLVNPLAAYALSRYRLRRTYHVLLFCLATIAFPAEVTMIPVFLQMKELHLLNTFGALVLPGLANGFSIFLLKGFFDSLPKELYEAAELDGASEWTMFWLIGMNLSKPILAVIALGAFATAYGTFFYALILAPDPRLWTIMVYIYQLRMVVDPPVVYASLILTAIPTLLVFIFCQNIILRGIVVPSEK